MTDKEIISASQAICDALNEEQDGLKRDILSHVGNTWPFRCFQGSQE